MQQQTSNKVFTIPNILSMIRLLLIPVFVGLFIGAKDNPTLLYWAIGVLVFSGFTDLVDGFIARRFNQVSELGKFLDPLADKFTQVVVVVCLSLRYKEIIPLMIICIVKELCQLIGILVLFRSRGKESLEHSQLIGKVTTFAFYFTMALILLWQNMPNWVLISLIAIVSALMLLSFINYIHAFVRIKTKGTNTPQEQQRIKQALHEKIDKRKES